MQLVHARVLAAGTTRPRRASSNNAASGLNISRAISTYHRASARRRRCLPRPRTRSSRGRAIRPAADTAAAQESVRTCFRLMVMASRRARARGSSARRFRRARMRDFVIEHPGLLQQNAQRPVRLVQQAQDRTSAFTTARCALAKFHAPAGAASDARPPSRAGRRGTRRATRRRRARAGRAPALNAGLATPPGGEPLVVRPGSAWGRGAGDVHRSASRIVSETDPATARSFGVLSTSETRRTSIRAATRPLAASSRRAARRSASRSARASASASRSAPRPRAGCSSRRRHPGALVNPDAASARRPPRRPRWRCRAKPPWRPPRRAPPTPLERRREGRVAAARAASAILNDFFQIVAPSLTPRPVASARVRLRLGAFESARARRRARFRKPRRARRPAGERLVARQPRPPARRAQHAAGAGGGPEARRDHALAEGVSPFRRPECTAARTPRIPTLSLFSIAAASSASRARRRARAGATPASAAASASAATAAAARDRARPQRVS